MHQKWNLKISFFLHLGLYLHPMPRSQIQRDPLDNPFVQESLLRRYPMGWIPLQTPLYQIDE